jgi:hypothetical protein
VKQNVFSYIESGIQKSLYIYLCIIYVSKAFFTSTQHKCNCVTCRCVKWTSLVFLDAVYYIDVAFHSPIEGRDASISCYATSHSVTTCELKYDVNFLPQRNSVNMITCVTVTAITFTLL